jgi:hypothetical protein
LRTRYFVVYNVAKIVHKIRKRQGFVKVNASSPHRGPMPADPREDASRPWTGRDGAVVPWHVPRPMTTTLNFKAHDMRAIGKTGAIRG